MTEISFHFNLLHHHDYVLGLVKTAARRHLATVVVGEKAFLESLSEGLWSLTADAFVGHCHQDATPQVVRFSPIILVTDLMRLAPLGRPADLLINCTSEVPQGFERYVKLLEMVTQEEKDKSDARSKWKYYSSRGYSIKKNDLATKKLANTSADGGN